MSSFGDVSELEGQQLRIPTGVLGQLVIGQDIGALLRLAHVSKENRRHLLDAEQLRRLNPSMPCQHAVVAIEKDGICEPEPANTIGDLPDLLCRVDTGITGIRF